MLPSCWHRPLQMSQQWRAAGSFSAGSCTPGEAARRVARRALRVTGSPPTVQNCSKTGRRSPQRHNVVMASQQQVHLHLVQ